MNDVLVVVAEVFVAACATVAVLCRDPRRQAVVLGVLALGLAVLFAVVQAPDVALSEITVGTALTPLLILLTAHRISRDTRTERTEDAGGGTGGGRAAEGRER